MSAWSLSPRRSRALRTATELYGRVVAQARAPALYADLGVPDTAEGRLEMVMLHTVLVIERLRLEGEAAEELSRALTERFITDLDDCLREMGVGDLTVPKKVKKAAAALYDRTLACRAALADTDTGSLASLLATHVWQDGGAGDPVRLAGYCRRLEADLASRSPTAVLAGELDLAHIAVV